MNATLNPEVLRWARVKAGLSEETLAEKIGVQLGLVREWEKSGTIPFTLVEKLAEKTRIAFGYLFLNEPPKQALPIADFRRLKETVSPIPSENLLEVIYAAQRKQDWYREYLISIDSEPLKFVGKATIKTPTKEVAADIRSTLKIGFQLAEDSADWDEAWRNTIEAIEAGGILVLCAGYAAGFTHRKLSVDEFRGFALADKYAPIIFINGADAPAARFFTAAHEVAHIWLGETGISNLDKTFADGNAVETFCNSVAAEVLLPLTELSARWNGDLNDTSEVERLSKKYKISRLVVARRAFDAGFFTVEKYNSYYRFLISVAKQSSGGNWHTNEKYQNSRQFSVTVLQEALSGRVSQRDVMEFLGIKKESTLRKYAQSLQGGVEWPIY